MGLGLGVEGEKEEIPGADWLASLACLMSYRYCPLPNKGGVVAEDGPNLLLWSLHTHSHSVGEPPHVHLHMHDT